MSAMQRRFVEIPEGGLDPAAGIMVQEGTMADYDALAHLHYRAGRPATHVRVLRARDERGELAGVLVVSMPTMGGRWRDCAWPGAFRTGNRGRDLARLNREVRTISRVIVEPRRRGLGIATMLVRRYLETALTEKTEAAAAMGACCPFFARAGMREWKLERTMQEERLLHFLERRGLRPEEVLEMERIPARVMLAIRSWGRWSRVTRELRGKKLVREAMMRVSCEMVAYTGG